MHRVTGEYIGLQFKPAVPQLKPGKDKPVKYATPAGMGNRLDVPKSVAQEVRNPVAGLIITEGVKKADALASRGIPVVALTGVWNWRNKEGTLGDWEDIPLVGRHVSVCFDSDAPTNPQVRHAMIRLVDWLKSKKAVATYLPVPTEVNGIPVKGVDDYLAAGGTVDALVHLRSASPPAAPVSTDASFTDAYLTDTVCAEALDGSFLFARGLGWMRYDGSRWTETGDAVLVEAIRQWAKGHWEDVVEEFKTDQSPDVRARMKSWNLVLTSNRLRALAGLAKGPLHCEATEFDNHPDLLNCPNGVVDLTTGELLDPDPSYLMTKMTGVAYDPSTIGDPDFGTALHALPEELHDWYQVRVGQAFTGHMASDDLMIVQQGGGENGKSTLAVPLKRAAGSYACLVSDRVILGNHDQHPTELMELKGARYALMEETPEARQLNVQQLKKVVGTPEITARKIRQDSVTFAASHSLFVNTNFAPAVVETDHATWRRLAMVRFPYTFRKRQEDVTGEMDRIGDPELRDRVMTREEPAQAALAWAVAGAVRWYANRRVMPALPALVQEDTDTWRRRGDLLMAFMEERLETGPQYTATTAELHQAFGDWLSPTEHKPWSQRLFADRFGGHSHVVSRHVELTRAKVDGAVKRFWSGVRVMPRDPEQFHSPGNGPFGS
jgi:P4 family phage/plasmid primase-like protien